MWVQLELSVELGFGFYWVRVSFFFSSDSRAWWDSGWDRARGIFPPRECFPGPPFISRAELEISPPAFDAAEWLTTPRDEGG